MVSQCTAHTTKPIGDEELARGRALLAAANDALMTTDIFNPAPEVREWFLWLGKHGSDILSRLQSAEARVAEADRVIAPFADVGQLIQQSTLSAVRLEPRPNAEEYAAEPLRIHSTAPHGRCSGWAWLAREAFRAAASWRSGKGESEDRERFERDVRQSQLLDWAIRVHGDDCTEADLAVRNRRFVEESIELFHALGGSETELEAARRRVFDKAPGDALGEFGDVAVTLQILAEAKEVSLCHAEREKAAELLAKPIKHFRARDAEKRGQGL